MADTDPARIGDVKAGLAAAKQDTNTRAKKSELAAAVSPLAAKDGSNVEADAFRGAIGAIGQGSSFTETSLDTTAEVAAGIPGGFFAEYPGKSSLSVELDASEVSIPAPSFRDAFSIKFFDKDQTNYQALGRQVVNHGVRAYVLGPSEGTGDWKVGYKDYVGALFVADARCGWADRGASGITTMAIQRGPAIASNEFAVTNPSAAGGGSAAKRPLWPPFRGLFSGSGAMKISPLAD
ncbi:hypothetical protein ACIGFJ_12625 [Brevundimonas diminuta]|uniref:hypothetical protein n=1 Tax=Brevundimonas diminuta TaxID=293 RepID=UPI0037C86FEE